MIAIGETVEHGGVKLECIEIDTSFETITCKGCYFDSNISLCRKRDKNKFACFDTRQDDKTVIFKEVTK